MFFIKSLVLTIVESMIELYSTLIFFRIKCDFHLISSIRILYINTTSVQENRTVGKNQKSTSQCKDVE